MRRIERALLLIGVLCLGWVAAVYLFARFDQGRQNRELDELRARRTAPRKATDVVLPAPAPPASGSKPRTRPATGALIGRVELPRLGVSAIVREGVDAGTLRKAVGHVPETALPGESGNAALAAHRDTFFRGLKHVREGDRVQVTTPDGVYEYRVAQTRVVNPEDVSVLEPTPEPTLTLITCYPFNFVGSAPRRFIVTARAPAAASPPAPPSMAAATAPLEGRPKPAAAGPVREGRLKVASPEPGRVAPSAAARPGVSVGAGFSRPVQRAANDHRKITRRAAVKSQPRPASTSARRSKPQREAATVAADPERKKTSVWRKLVRALTPKPPRPAPRIPPATPDPRIP